MLNCVLSIVARTVKNLFNAAAADDLSTTPPAALLSNISFLPAPLAHGPCATQDDDEVHGFAMRLKAKS
jgi:hypothetical protein